jgi:SnoaL-like domain
MEFTNKQVAEAFSTGKFEMTYRHLSDNIIWEVVGESYFEGKAKVVENCQAVDSYFKSVTTKFEVKKVIEQQNSVAIEGTAAFIRNGNLISFVQACDVYEFNEEGIIEKITSYCIQKK